MGRHSQQRQRSRSLSVGSVGSIGSNLDLSKSKVAKVVDQDRRAVNLKQSPKESSLSAPLRNRGSGVKDSLDFLQFPSEDTGVSLSVSPDLSDEPQSKRARSSRGENSPRGRKSSIDELQNDMLNEQFAATDKKSQRKLVVHRIKHSGASSKSIVCMCATPKHSKHNFLAIAREDGSVELRAVDQKYRFIGSVPGNQNKSVDTLTWVMHENPENGMPTLIGASRDGSIFIVDFIALRLRSITSSGGGGVFALESLYQTSGADSPLFAAGCEDGAVRIFLCQPDKSLTMKSSIPTTGASVLSLSWRQMEERQSSHTVKNDLEGTYLYAGVSDGTIRTYIYSGGQSKSGVWKAGNRMTVETQGRQTNTRIWSLKLLKDWTLVSADSLGNVQFWDGKSGALEQTFKQTNENADVLDLAISMDECKVFASGVDSKVVCFERPPETSLYNNRRWVRSHAHRPHTHDVRSLVICFAKQHTLQGRNEISHAQLKNEFLCTGGIDMKLCVFPTLNFRIKKAKVFQPSPSKSPAFLSRDAQLLALIQRSTVDFYRIKESPKNLKKNRHVEVPEAESKVGSVELRKRSNFSCGAISQDGKFMVLCDPFSVSLFKLKHTEDGLIEPTMLPLDTKVHAVSSAAFGDDMTLILAGADGKLTVFDINDDAVEKRETVVPQRTEDDDMDESSEINSSRRLSVQSAETFDQGRWIATLSNTCHGSIVDVYKRERGSYSHWWTLPTLAVPVSAINFLDQEEPKLAVGCLNFEAFLFDLEGRRIDELMQKSQQNDKNHFSKELGNRPDYPIQLSHHKDCKNQLMMVSFPTPRNSSCLQESYFRHLQISFGRLLVCHPCEINRLHFARSVAR